MSLDETLRAQIQSTLDAHPVLLFMKGTKSFPQCGFSATVVHILKEHGADFHTVNILTDPAIRQGMKDFANWPTFPQLYVRGKFVGGCDIVRDMHVSGELGPLLAEAKT